MSMTISMSKLLKYLSCRQEYYYYYEERLRPVIVSSNLVFGKVIHRVIEEYLRGACADTASRFKELWDEAVEVQALKYSSVWSEEKMRKTGMYLADEFPEVWSKAGLHPLTANNGEPLLEVEMKMPLTQDLILVGVADFIGVNQDGEVVILDFKTPSTPTDEEFLKISDQLGGYQILAEANARELGIDKVDHLGYMELIKRPVKDVVRNNTRQPEVMPPIHTPRRGERLTRDLRNKFLWAAQDIRAKRFVRDPMMPFNSPCSLCDFQSFCIDGDMTGLYQKDQEKAA